MFGTISVHFTMYEENPKLSSVECLRYPFTVHKHDLCVFLRTKTTFPEERFL